MRGLVTSYCFNADKVTRKGRAMAKRDSQKHKTALLFMKCHSLRDQEDVTLNEQGKRKKERQNPRQWAEHSRLYSGLFQA